MTTPRRPRFGPGEILVLLVIGVIALVVVTRSHEAWIEAALEKLASGTSALIAVIMLVEYLLLKGADRSELYRRELEALRLKRRDDLLALREIETELVELRARLGTPPGEGDSVPDASRKLDDARRSIDRVLQSIRRCI